MEVSTGSTVPPPSGLENILALLALAADHHDPATETKHDLESLAAQATAMSPQASTLGKILDAVFKSAPAVLALIEALRPHAKATAPLEPVTTTHVVVVVPPPPTAPPAPAPAPLPAAPMPDGAGLNVEAVLALIEALRPHAKATAPLEPVTTTHVVVVVPPPPTAPPAPAPAPLPAAPMPDGAGLNVEEVFGPNRTGRVQRKFRVDDPTTPDGPYQLVMLENDGQSPDDTTSLDDQSGLFLGGILFKGGEAVKIEEVEGARGLLYWKATNIDTGEVNKLAKVNGVWTASNNEHSTNWRTDGEIVNSDGFAATVHLHDKSSGYDITFGVEGMFEAVPIRTPEVR